MVEILRSGDVGLLTLTGPGGTGKTRLALHAAAEASDSYPDGIWWIPLAPLRAARRLVTSLAQALSVEEEPGSDFAAAVAARLDRKRALLLLDNAEHLLPAVAREIAKLRDIAGPTILVTSRERLQLQGEQLYSGPSAGGEGRRRALRDPRSRPRDGSAAHEYGRRALRSTRQLAARPRAGRGPDTHLLAAAAARAAVRATRPAHGGARRRPAPADAPRDDRMVARPPRRSRAEPLPPPLRLCRRLHVRGARGRVRDAPRHRAVARRQEPPSSHSGTSIRGSSCSRRSASSPPRS